jgi:hypothetical protein
MKKIEWFDQRFYKIITKGKVEYLPSVTTIISVTTKPFLKNWVGEIGNAEAAAYSKERMDFGSFVHSLCEHVAKGGMVIFNDSLEPAYKPEQIAELKKYNKVIVTDNQFAYYHLLKFSQFLEMVKPYEIYSEQIIYSIKYGYAGTMDLLIYIPEGDYDINGAKPLHLEEGYYVADIKTGNVYPEAHLQMAAYQVAYNEFYPEFDIVGSLILHTNSKTKRGVEGFSAILKTKDEMKEDFQNFLKVYEMYKLYPVSAPKVFEMPSFIQLDINSYKPKEQQLTMKEVV